MILIALGANLPSRYGPPEDTLKAAIAEMRARSLKLLKSSSIWLTAPVPASDQPWYRNAVIVVDTQERPAALMALLQGIEKDFGRVRSAGNQNAPRLLDLDILAFHDEILEQEGLKVPHPRLHERAFVLYPLQEVAPDWCHPVLKHSVSDLIAVLPADQKIEKLQVEERQRAAQ
ncbi:MAG: 2-amino-4-hydroxy-6-hydroxymethyldihydropteridine diphosphokinase [Alphaproteobacteria bacterium]|nr:2-amino-4-hydroxy-6-hydroxymethyldihydropteridine diphosphokinase [Alphaproteobacteria bacterium]